MDTSLSSSRYGRDSTPYTRDSSRGGHSFRSRGSGPFRNDSRHGGPRYSPYPARGAGRFHGSPPPQHRHASQSPPPSRVSATTAPEDPTAVMMQTLTSMMAQMGDWAAASRRCVELDAQQLEPQTRGLVRILAKNVQDLVEFLCTDKNAPLFLSFGKDAAGSAADVAGPLAALTVLCAATLPMQTPCYAALTLALEENLNAVAAQGDQWKLEYQGFAQRCVDFACHRLFTDLDSILAVSRSSNLLSDQDDEYELILVDSFLRCKLVLRYLALLTQGGVLTAYLGQEEDRMQQPEQPDAIDIHNPMSFSHVLVSLTKAAKNASRWSCRATGAWSKTLMTQITVLLSTLVLSTIPYAMSCIPSNLIFMLIDQLETSLFSSHGNHSSLEDTTLHYTSPFAPGLGTHAILLAKEQKDDPMETSIRTTDPDMNQINDDDDEDDDDMEDGPVCADSLQDLFRTIRKLMQGFYESTITSKSHISSMTQFCFLWDQPWACLSHPHSNTDINPTHDSSRPFVQLVFSGKSLLMKIPNTCQSIPLLLNTNMDPHLISSYFQCHQIDGIIFGRLAVLDNTADDNDDTGDKQEETMEPLEITKQPMDSYIQSFNSIDRYFLNDMIRDVIVSHRPRVSDTGIERGSCKEVAEQLWTVPFLFSHKNLPISNSHNMIQGLEYGIVESLIVLLIQSPSSTLSSSSTLSHVYLSRLVLELIKYQPQVITPSLAVIVTIIVEQIIPILTPSARENFSKWFAFHLNNTDYQWSSECWDIWTPYAVHGLARPALDGSKDYLGLQKRNSRGEFISYTVQFMMDLVSSPDIVATDCLPDQPALVEYIASAFEDNESFNDDTNNAIFQNIQNNLVNKIWTNKEDPESVEAYLFSEAQSLKSEGKLWIRTRWIIHSIFYPAQRYRVQLRSYIMSAFQEAIESTSMEDVTKDVLRDICDAVTRYKNVIHAAVTRDKSGDKGSGGLTVNSVKGLLRGISGALSNVIHMALAGDTAKQGSSMKSNELETDQTIAANFYIITEMKRLLSFSDSFFNICLTLLVKVGVITEISVLMWSLAEPYGCSGDCFQHVSKHWCDLSASSIIVGIDTRLKSDADVLMITDTDVNESEESTNEKMLVQRIKQVTDFVQEMLHYASERVRQLDSVFQNNRGTNPSAWEVDLKEGLKMLNFYSVRSIISALKNDSKVKDLMKSSKLNSLEEWVERSGFQGTCLE